LTPQVRPLCAKLSDRAGGHRVTIESGALARLTRIQTILPRQDLAIENLRRSDAAI
jgi:hypothetical protein